MKKVAVVIGHSASDKGAHNKTFDVSEYDYNKELAHLVQAELTKLGLESVIVERDSLDKLPSKINATKADVCISLHCNAYNTNVSGTETLFFEGSAGGRKLADFIQDEMVEVLDLRNRGLNETSSSERGGFLLRKTCMPCVILEPFFIDNDVDLMVAQDCKADLAKAIAKGCNQYF